MTIIICALLVGLRMFIGWQFLYEGMWKLDTLDSPRPWTSAGYLKNAQGRKRDWLGKDPRTPHPDGVLSSHLLFLALL